jgi:hypothetical protein
MKRKKQLPIDASFLNRFVASQQLDATVVTGAELDAWAAEHFAGKTRDERAAMIGSEFLNFLSDKLELAAERLMDRHRLN